MGKTLPVFILILVLQACGGTVIPENPLKKIKKTYANEKVYTVLLADMDLQDNKYLHKYTLLFPKGKSAEIKKTDWQEVSDDFFDLHVDNLGMEIFSKGEEGNYNNLVTPPGFTHFIGNTNFGTWSSPYGKIDSTSVWQFHNNDGGENLQSALGLGKIQVNKGEYDRFQSKYFLNRPYYGQKIGNDSVKYGTRSPYFVVTRPLFYSRRLNKRNFRKSYGPFSYGSRGGGGFGK